MNTVGGNESGGHTYNTHNTPCQNLRSSLLCAPARSHLFLQVCRISGREVNKAPRSKTGHGQGTGLRKNSCRQESFRDRARPTDPAPSLALTEDHCPWPDFSVPQPSLQNVEGAWGSHLFAVFVPLLQGRPCD